MDFLVAAAVFASGEVVLVVSAHLRRQARNVISPARQNFAYDWINAPLTHLGVPKSAKPAEPPRYSRIGPNPSVWDASSTRLINSPPRVPIARSASLRPFSGWLFCSDSSHR